MCKASERQRLLVRSEEGRDFAADEPYERAWQHLVGIPSRVLVVVIRVRQDIKERLD